MNDTIRRLREARSKTELFSLKADIEKSYRELNKKEQELDEKESELDDITINIQKYVEYNSQSYASFYNTKLEKDKSILTLSVAGLGFLITFTNFAKDLSLFEYCIFIFAALSFLFCVYNVITIFDKNAIYIIEITQDKDVSVIEGALKKLDKRAIISFYIGIFLSFCLGASISYIKLNEGAIMSQTEKSTQRSNETEKKSYSGSSAMNPRTSTGKPNGNSNTNGDKK